jgi:WD40 repeat protein
MRLRSCCRLLGVFAILSGCDEPTATPPPQPPSPSEAARPEFDFTFTHLRTIETEQTAVSPSLSPNGKFVVAIVENVGPKFWDASTGERIDSEEFTEVFRDNEFSIYGRISFSPSGRWLAIASGYPETLELVDWQEQKTRTGRVEIALKQSLAFRVPEAVIFSEEERSLATGWGTGEVLVHRIPKLELALRIDEGMTAVPLGYSERRRRMITVGSPTPVENEAPEATRSTDYLLREAGLRLWSTDPWKLERVKLDEDVGYREAGAYGKDSAISLNATREGGTASVRVWDLDAIEPKRERVFERLFDAWCEHMQTGYISILEYARSGQVDSGFRFRGFAMLDPLGSGDASDGLTASAIEEASGLEPVSQPSVRITRGAFSSDGTLFVVAYENSLQLYRVAWKERR